MHTNDHEIIYVRDQELQSASTRGCIKLLNMHLIGHIIILIHIDIHMHICI